MIDRKELLQINFSPFSEWVQQWYYAYEVPCHFTMRYSLMVMFCRYYDALNKKYHWDIEIETFREILTPEKILDDEDCDDFFNIYNVGKELLLKVGKRFGWNIADIYIDTERNPAFDEFHDGKMDLRTFLDIYDQLDPEEKRIFMSYENIFGETRGLEGECEVCVLEHPKLGKYLEFRKSNMKQIRKKFKEEDERIMSLLDWISHPLFLQFDRNEKQEGDCYYAAFVCGFNGEFETDIYYLTSEWIIGSFVVYELLLHAEQIFQYQEV